MFKKILGMLGSVKEALADSAEFRHLRNSFDVLQGIDPFLPERAFLYVVQGKEETVLLDLQRSTQTPGKLLGGPGRLCPSFSVPDDKLSKMVSQGLAERSKFYAALDQVNPPVDVCARLGKLFAAADRGNSLEHPGGQIPDWLQYLVNDAFYSSFNDYRPKVTRENRGAFNLSLLHRLLEQEGLPGTQSLTLVFERKNLSNYYWDNMDFALQWPDLVDYMIEHQEATVALPGALSAAGRTVLAQTLGRPELFQSFPQLLVVLALDGSKGVRAVASALAGQIPEVSRQALLHHFLRKGSPTERVQAADLLGQIPSASSIEILSKVQEEEPSKAVQQAIRNAISRLNAAHDAADLDMPQAPVFASFPDEKLGEDVLPLLLKNHAELLESHRRSAEDEIERNKTQKYQSQWGQKGYNSYCKLSEAGIRESVAVLNGEAPGKVLNRAQLETLGHAGRLQAHPQFGLLHLTRWFAASQNEGFSRLWFDDRFQRWLHAQSQPVDLRAIADALQRTGSPVEILAGDCLCDAWQVRQPQYMLAPELIWPFFAEHPEFIEEGLGLRPSTRSRYREYALGHTLGVLDTFPVVPALFTPRVMEIALGDGKTHRIAAQSVLSKLPDIGKRVIESLASSKMETRIVAAEWLAELGHQQAVPALYKALAKETRETARAIILTSLERLGEDISPQLAPAVLQKEAEKGLSAKAPSGLAWFPLEGLPDCRWAADCSAVPKSVIKWWLVLACKLKDPAGNALLDRYLELLDKQSRSALGIYILRQFIVQDTRFPTLEEASAYAQSNLAQRMQMYQQWVKWDPAYGAITQEQAFEQLKREKLAVYLGTAIGEKGILALIAAAPGHEIVSLLRSYTKDHYTRRAQIEAMLEAAAKSDDPAVIQLILSMARRYRTASVQTKARALVDEIANRNNWSQDQLADRTIPTAGFDDSGRLLLEYGEREFVVTLDDGFKPVLANAEGKQVKALPEPRKMDDPGKIKEAKALWAGCKKELKQVVDLQSARLYEAMCASRIWPAAEWREYLHEHPLMGRLIQQLIWVDCDAEGTENFLFRPTEDGSLIDLDDNDVTVAASGYVRLAHAALLPADVAKAWLKHLLDYKIKPLFAQMTRPLPRFPESAGGEQVIKDRLGWMSDTFTLRGAFNKLGYQRASAEDGGFFYCYQKDFASIGLRVLIEFSGNTLPEENVAAALKTLCFERLTAGYGDRVAPLKSVPSVLLAEAHADYLAVASACAGHDPEWERKVAW